MLALGIESSSVTASAALLKEDRLLAEWSLDSGMTHSQTLLPMIDEMVRLSNVQLSDLDLIAVSAGPGSYTGLRIGSATAKGLGLALDIPLAEVSTLEVMACSCWDFPGIVCPVIDARRDQVFTACYRFAGGKKPLCLLEPSLLLLPDLAERLRAMAAPGERITFTGDAMAKASAALGGTLPGCQAAPSMCAAPRAGAVAYLGALLAAERKTVSADAHRPFYLRKTQAEQLREQGIYTKGSIIPGEGSGQRDLTDGVPFPT